MADKTITPTKAAAEFNRGNKGGEVSAVLTAWAGPYRCWYLQGGKVDWAKSQEAREDLEAAGAHADDGPHAGAVWTADLFAVQKRVAQRDPTSGTLRGQRWTNPVPLTKAGISMDPVQVDLGPVLRRQDGQERLLALLLGRELGYLDAAPSPSQRREMARDAATEVPSPEFARGLSALRTLRAAPREALEGRLAHRPLAPAGPEPEPSQRPPFPRIPADPIPDEYGEVEGGPRRAPTRSRPLLFVLHAAADRLHVANLRNATSAIRRQGTADIVFLSDTRGGVVTEDWISDKLARAEVVIGLLSVDFYADDDLHRYANEAARRQPPPRMVPVLVRACAPSGVWLSKAPLPPNGRPVTAWADSDAAWLAVVNDLSQIIESLRPAP